jgi:poly(ADP-ribose) glycohydrolase ARH3
MDWLAELTPEEDRFAGALLGTACGDALGCPVEGHPDPGEVRDFVGSWQAPGRYTDDTQMAVALADSLVRTGGVVDGEDCARAYAERFEPHRGYGAGAYQVIERLRQGEDYRKTGTAFFPDGSFGNGSAMRIAPVGLLHGTGEAPNLQDAVFEAVRCTHVHPEALDGAVLQARLVGLLSRFPAGAEPHFSDFEPDLRRRARTKAFSRQLDALTELFAEGADDRSAAARLGNGIRAVEAVPAAIWAAFRHGLRPEESIVRAIALGGDTDTIGAMTGALVGARRGASQLPRRWLEGLENGPWGRDAIAGLAKELATLPNRKEETR